MQIESFETMGPFIEPELVVRLVEAAVKAKSPELELTAAQTIRLWNNPRMIYKPKDH